MRIDAHAHLWSLARGDYGWLTPALGPIHRDFGPADLEANLARHALDRAILVQAAPTAAETDHLLGIARAHPFVAGVVGWVDLAAPDAADLVRERAREPLLLGLRPMVQDIADDDWLAAPRLAPALDAMADAGLVFDALVLPRHLPRLLVVAERHPGLRIVVDHLAKPPVKAGQLDPWRADMAALAARANVSCKLSGLVTEARVGWTVGDLAPFVTHVLAAFGPGRVLWGSDWPVAILGGGYDAWMAATERLLAELSSGEREAIMGGTARHVYLGKGRGR